MPDDPNPNPNPAPTPAPAPAPAPPAPTPPAPTGGDPLGEAGLRALQAERDARADAERKYQAEKTARETLEREKMTKEQQLEADAKAGRDATATATSMLHKAMTVTALAGKGLVGPKALAASKLIDGLQFDDQGIPTNLDARIEAAKVLYGADLFTGATPAPTPTPNAPTPPTPPPHPSLHQGPRQPAAEDEEAKFDAFMRANFPDAVPAKT